MSFIRKIKYVLNNPWLFVYSREHRLLSFVYKAVYVPYLVTKVRKKKEINVVFIVSDLGAWKTESLYLKMLAHPRFSPKLLLVPLEGADYSLGILKDYLDSRKYEYYTIKPQKSIKSTLNSDIVLYQRPYIGCIEKKYDFPYNLNSLICHVEYSFRNRCLPDTGRNPFYYYLWQYFLENKTVVDELESILPSSYVYKLDTGLPIMDVLLKGKDYFCNPWNKNNQKKRIIYAPHHTVYSENLVSSSPVDYATFLIYADFMKEMVIKYQDKVQWAFKPHPLLRSKLNIIWGEKRTEEYYAFWEKTTNTQLSEGEYIGLFKHSNAMIHDCGSFKLEYLYTGNPVLYLVKENLQYDYSNWQTREALTLHYHAHNENEIEQFILNVIDGKDTMKDKRSVFVRSYLTPKNNKNACDNIIEAILGKE